MVKIRAYFSQLGVFVSIFMLSTLNILSISVTELFLSINYSSIGIVLNGIVLMTTIILVMTFVIGTKLAGSTFSVRYPWAPSSIHQVDARISISILPLIGLIYGYWFATVANDVFKRRRRWSPRFFVRESVKAVELCLSSGFRSVTISSSLLNNSHVIEHFIKKIQLTFPDVVTEISHTNLTQFERVICSLVTKKPLTKIPVLKTTVRFFLFS